MTEAFARVVGAGARSESDVIEKTYGRLAFFSDPFGHGFCLIEWKGKGYDELLKHPRTG